MAHVPYKGSGPALNDRRALPNDIVMRLHGELKAVLASKEVQEQILMLGMLPATGSSRQELQPFINSEIERRAKVVRQVGLAGRMCLTQGIGPARSKIQSRSEPSQASSPKEFGDAAQADLSLLVQSVGLKVPFDADP